MKFEITYKVGKSIRTKNIQAKDLDDAEEVCNKKFRNWVDIIMIDKTKGKESY